MAHSSTSTRARPRDSDQAVSLLEQCFDAANSVRASDVHIEVNDEALRIRMRVDGRLRQWRELPLELHAQVMSRLKVLAKLDISEKRRPQDGRFTLETREGLRDYRLATSPMLLGEKAVVRVMHQNLSRLTVNSVGYSDPNHQLYLDLLARPHGLLLHCGPTGSGKTTALYAAINHLSDGHRNIQTIEDPVEGRLPGVNQAQVNADIGLTFASVLRCFLRQDCDVMLVGEVRDVETAELAVQASLTGHTVLGTLHTNSAVGAVARLVDMGIPPFFIASGLVGCVSQRLVRRLCKHCRTPYAPPADIQRQYNLGPQHQLFEPTGCQACNNSGYRGRIGIQEILPVTTRVRDAIQAGAPESELQAIGQHEGLIPIIMDGVAKAVAGHTTLEEVYRCVASDT